MIKDVAGNELEIGDNAIAIKRKWACSHFFPADGCVVGLREYIDKKGNIKQRVCLEFVDRFSDDQKATDTQWFSADYIVKSANQD